MNKKIIKVAIGGAVIFSSLIYCGSKTNTYQAINIIKQDKVLKSKYNSAEAISRERHRIKTGKYELTNLTEKTATFKNVINGNASTIQLDRKQYNILAEMKKSNEVILLIDNNIYLKDVTESTTEDFKTVNDSHWEVTNDTKDYIYSYLTFKDSNIIIDKKLLKPKNKFTYFNLHHNTEYTIHKDTYKLAAGFPN